ncbi:MAG: hypothetical protein ACI4J1_02485 [Ruminiclostridium sp.]
MFDRFAPVDLDKNSCEYMMTEENSALPKGESTGSYDLLRARIFSRCNLHNSKKETMETSSFGAYYRNIPIAAITANAFAEDIPETAGEGMNVHLSKPIHIDSLKSALSQYPKQ